PGCRRASPPRPATPQGLAHGGDVALVPGGRREALRAVRRVPPQQGGPRAGADEGEGPLDLTAPGTDRPPSSRARGGRFDGGGPQGRRRRRPLRGRRPGRRGGPGSEYLWGGCGRRRRPAPTSG